MDEEKQAGSHHADEERPVTKTRLRRGEVGRKKPPLPVAEIVDVVPPVHGDIEEYLCDLSRDEEKP
jgi:hypothetical protein